MTNGRRQSRGSAVATAPDVSASGQVEVLQALKQSATAWLLDVSTRTLRDYADLPREKDGTYDARKVVQWAARRLPSAQLDDDAFERLTLIVDAVCGEFESALPTIAEFLRSVDEQFGDLGLALVARELLRSAEQWIDEDPDLYRDRTAIELRRQLEKDMETAHREDQVARLRFYVRCEVCKKIRHGRRWHKGEPPEGLPEQPGRCPDCK